MDLLSKYDRVIQCAKRVVRLTKKDGTSVEFVAAIQSNQAIMFNQTKVIAFCEKKLTFIRLYHQHYYNGSDHCTPDLQYKVVR
jgi:hypothetical protein